MPWRLLGLIISTLCLLYQSIFHFWFLATISASLNDPFTFIIVLPHILALAFSLSLSVRQWFKRYRWMAISASGFSILAVLGLFLINLALSDFGIDLSYLEGFEEIPNLSGYIFLLLSTFAVFIIPIWVNWPRKTEPVDKAFE